LISFAFVDSIHLFFLLLAGFATGSAPAFPWPMYSDYEEAISHYSKTPNGLNPDFTYFYSRLMSRNWVEVLKNWFRFLKNWKGVWYLKYQGFN